MNHVVLYLEHEPNNKKQKTHSEYTKNINNSMSNMTAMPYDEHITLEKPPNVNDDAGVFLSTFNTKPVFKHAVAALVLDQKHIDDLPVELLMRTFDYLSLEDLCSIRQTCRQWRQIAGYIFQHNYSAVETFYLAVRTFHKTKFTLDQNGVNLNAFIQLIRKMKIDRLDEFKHYINEKPHLQQLININFSSMDLTDIKIDWVNEVLDKVEHLKISHCKMNKYFIDFIVGFAPNLKCLQLIRNKMENDWVHSKYPTLETFTFLATCKDEIVAIETMQFLENNPNIHHCKIDPSLLWHSSYSMQTSKVALDVLTIDMTESDTTFVPICQLLNKCHDLGIFKCLELTIDPAYHEIDPKKDNDALASIKGLKKLNVIFCTMIEPIEVKNLESLEEIRATGSSFIIDIGTAANNLRHLKRINFEYANFEHIVLIVKNYTNLKEIIVESFDNVVLLKYLLYPSGGDLYKNVGDEKPKFIDLARLNRERSKLSNAKKITLYVEEEEYLTTKWTTKKTDLEFIMLKRMESFQNDLE